jgi:hypothetical protein
LLRVMVAALIFGGHAPPPLSSLSH